jgi:hypothetical protein
VKVVVANAVRSVAFEAAAWTNSQARTELIQEADKAGLGRLANLMLMAISPRPSLSLRAINDPTEKGNPSLLESYRLLADYYKQVGAKGDRYWQPPVANYFHATGHDFMPDAQELAYTWLAMQLRMHAEEKTGTPRIR